MANSTRSALPSFVATFVPYCPGASTCSSSAPSCTSPHVPRVLTLVRTRLRSPTPDASACISPRPRCTCSRRSLTVRNDSPSRASKRSLQALVHRDADLLQASGVVLLQRAEPLLDRGAQRLQLPLVAFRERRQPLRERFEAVALDVRHACHRRRQQVAELRQAGEHLLAQFLGAGRRLGTRPRHLVAQRPVGPFLAVLDGAQPAVEARDVDSRDANEQEGGHHDKRRQQDHGQDDQGFHHRAQMIR